MGEITYVVGVNQPIYNSILPVQEKTRKLSMHDTGGTGSEDGSICLPMPINTIKDFLFDVD